MSVFVGSLNNFSRTQSGFKKESPVMQQCYQMVQYEDYITLLSKIFRNDLKLLKVMKAGIITSNVAIQTEGFDIEHKTDGVQITTCHLDSEYIRDCSDVIKQAKVLVHNNDATCSIEDMRLLHETKGPSIFIGPTHEQTMLSIPSVYLEWNVSNLCETAKNLLSLGCKNVILGNETNAILKNAELQVLKHNCLSKDAFVASIAHYLVLTQGNLRAAFDKACDS